MTPDAFQGKGLGELQEIVPHEDRGLVLRVAHPSFGPVPAERREPGVAHPAHHAPLALVQGVEADEDEVLRLREGRGEDVGRRPGSEPLGEGAVHLAFIGQAARLQRLPERPVQRQEDVPDLQETALDVLLPLPGGAVPLLEMPEEALQGGALRLREIGEGVAHVLELGEVGEQLRRVDEVLVHVAEVRQQHVAPEDELIQGLGLGVDLAIASVQLQEKRHP